MSAAHDRSHSPEVRGVFNVSSSLALLWKKASPTLDASTLRWFADGAAVAVADHAAELQGVLEGLGCIILSDGETGSFQTPESGSELLFSLARQIDSLRGLADIAAHANYQIRQNLGERA